MGSGDNIASSNLTDSMSVADQNLSSIQLLMVTTSMLQPPEPLDPPNPPDPAAASSSLVAAPKSHHHCCRVCDGKTINTTCYLQERVLVLYGLKVCYQAGFSSVNPVKTKAHYGVMCAGFNSSTMLSRRLNKPIILSYERQLKFSGVSNPVHSSHWESIRPLLLLVRVRSFSDSISRNSLAVSTRLGVWVDF